MLMCPEAPARAEVRWHFRITAEPLTQLPMRLLGLFAQRDLLPGAVRWDCDADALTIEIEQAGIDEAGARIVAEKMRSAFGVCSVALAALG